MKNKGSPKQGPIPVVDEEMPILLCPVCKKNIPFISLISDDNIIKLQIKCDCTEKSIYQNLESYLESLNELQKEEIHKCSKGDHLKNAQKYCSICQQWLCQDCLSFHKKNIGPNHVLRNKELILSCLLHKEDLQSYCEDCKKSLCKRCDKDHHSHRKKPINEEQYNIFLKECTNFQKMTDRNRKLRDTFNHQIDTTIKSLVQWKTEVNNAYSANKKTNKFLEELCELLKISAEILLSNPNYSLNKSMGSLKICKPAKLELDKTINGIENNYSLLMKYYEEKNTIDIPMKVKEHKSTPRKDGNNTNTGSMLLISHTYSCLGTLTGHNNSLNALTQLEDGKLASGDNDSAIKIWDLTLFKCLATMKGHAKSINSLIQLKDKRLASSGDDTLIKLWDITTFKCLYTMEGHTMSVLCLIQLSDASLASCGRDDMIKLWDITTMKCLTTMEGHTLSVCSLIQLKDERLASCGLDYTIKLWDLKVMKTVASLKDHKACVCCICQLQDERLASCGDDNMIKFWDVTLLKCVATINNYHSIRFILELKDGKLASCGKSKKIKLWNIDLMECFVTIEGHDDWINEMVQLNNGRLVSGGCDKKIKLWDI